MAGQLNKFLVKINELLLKRKSNYHAELHHAIKQYKRQAKREMAIV